eukprot:gene20191-biopygen6567
MLRPQLVVVLDAGGGGSEVGVTADPALEVRAELFTPCEGHIGGFGQLRVFETFDTLLDAVGDKLGDRVPNGITLGGG